MTNMLKKAVSFLLAVSLILALVPKISASFFPRLNLVFSPEIPVEEVEEDPAYGRIRLHYNDIDGKLQYFDFFVTATRAVTGTRYKTPIMWIKVGNYPKFYFDASDLASWRPIAGSAGQAVRVPVEEILNYIIRTDPSVNDIQEAKGVLFSYDRFSLGFKVEVYNASTGAVLGSTEEKEQAIQMLRSFGFGEAHIKDVEKMFQDLPLLIPRVTASYYEVKEHSGSWGIEYQGKRYEWVRNITFDFFQLPGFGESATVRHMPAGKESLFSGLEFLCSGVAYPPDQTTVNITGETSKTVTPTREQSGINVRFYFVKKDLPDFAVTSLNPGTNETEPNQAYTGTVSYVLKPGYKEPVEARLVLTHNGWPLKTPEGQEIDGQRLTFNPGETKTFSFRYTGQEGNSTLRAEIWPVQGDDANPDDNVREITVPRKRALPPPGGCGNPITPFADPEPQSGSDVSYTLVKTEYSLHDFGLVSNVESPEVIRGDSVKGRFCLSVIETKTWNVSHKEWRPYERQVGTDEKGKPIYEIDYIPYWTTPTYWGKTQRTVPVPYEITASLPNTAITPNRGTVNAGKHEFTWRTTGVNTSQVNRFTLTVTLPDGKKHSTTDECTVFLPRGIELGEVTILDDYVYSENRQIAFIRVTNLRDVGEERVALTYKMNGKTVKTETLILPSGPPGAAKSFARAFEFTPPRWDENITLSVEARAEALPGADTPERRKVLTANKSKTFYNEDLSRPVDIPALKQRNRTAQSIQIPYHYTTSVQNRAYVNSIMPQVRYNMYSWATKTETYTERLNVSVTIDSWQGTKGKGRGWWEIYPKFGPDASRTVRAGQGFELIVRTDYNTDFDTRAPSSKIASAVNGTSYVNFPMSLGVTPQGVTRTWATFPYANYIKSVDIYDNKNYIKGDVGLRHCEPDPKGWGRDGVRDLEVTHGRKGAYSIKWELPNVCITNMVGNTYCARKHFIDKFYPDAYILNGKAYGNTNVIYRFHVVAEVAGVTNLLRVHDDYINVFGSMFDDVYHTRPPEIR